jgi:NAD+ diphosphatase
LGLLNWRAKHRCCGACGGPLEEHPTEAARKCGACGHVDYPGMFPAVIVRVEKDGKILLARHAQRSQEFYTCLAGYVEVGESLEEAVHREVREEVGIELDAVRYVCSQPWPYPNQLMLAFTAKWKSGELVLQPDELSDARWFDQADLPNIPPEGSVAYRLIRGLI